MTGRGLASRLFSIAGVIALMLSISAPAQATDPPVLDLLQHIDDLFRGESSHATMTMKVKTRRFERELTMEAWSRGTDKSLIRILEPARERGTATLKVDDQIWNYLPKVDRTIKVPASMMSASWMGSHFTNDDLVQETRYSDDFECVFGAVQATQWEIECVPHEDTPVAWGKVTLIVGRPDRLPRELRFYDERGGLARTITYDEVIAIGGRSLPRRMRVLPADEPGELTEIFYRELEIDIEVADSVFSLQSLRR